MASHLTLYLVAAVLTLLAVFTFFSPNPGTNELPRVHPRIPFVGHLVGLARHTWKYYEVTSRSTQSPVYYLPILNGGQCIVQTKEGAAQVFRQSKSLVFRPLAAQTATVLLNMSRDGYIKMWKQGHDTPETECMKASHRALVQTLGPGEHLMALEKSLFRGVSKKLQAATSGDQSKETFPLFHWVRVTLNGSTLPAIYGDQAPFDEHNIAKFEKQWYAFEHGMNALMVTSSIAPSVFAREAYNAREALVKDLMGYFRSGIPGSAAEVQRLRASIFEEANLKVEDQARWEVAILIGFIGNTAPAAFWLLSYIHHTPGLLQDIRAELDEQLKASKPNHKSGDAIPFSFLSKLRTTCPLLKSAYDETLRLHQHTANTRVAIEDTWLRFKEQEEQAYLIKKGQMVVIPNTVLHHNEAVFPEPGKFDPRRYSRLRAHPGEYRPWGGGENMCPGRHFATSEILGTITLMIIGFDMECVDAKGAKIDWWIPEDFQPMIAAGVWHPKTDINVRLMRREGYSLQVDLDS